MPLSNKKIKRIYEKNKKHFFEMEHYDKTREKLWEKRRIDIALTYRLIKRLKEISKKTGSPVSHIIEEKIKKL